jgi:hypothetical protein
MAGERDTASAAKSRGRSAARPLADFVSRAIDPVLARRGFGQSQLVTYWDEIVGDRLAAMSQPVKLHWPQAPVPDGDARHAGATLIIRVESGFALELQHCADLVIERVNAHFGWRCVSRLALKQGPLERKTSEKPRAKIDPDSAAAAAGLVETITEEPLRCALAQLGAHVLTACRERDLSENSAARAFAAKKTPEKPFGSPQKSSSFPAQSLD